MRGKPFEHGNTLGKGRPPGSRNEKTRFLKALLLHGDALIDKCKLMALNGDKAAMRLCMERLLPPAKHPGTRFPLPAGLSTDLKNLLPILVKQTAKGRLSAYEAEALARVLDSQLRVMEASEFEKRIRALETAQSALPESEEEKP
jgi:hypothetical protein